MQKQAVLEQPRLRLFDNAALTRLILPLIVEQFLTIAVGMVDSVMVSSVGEAAVSAVSLVDTVNVLIVNLFAALATGGAVVAGQYLGRQDRENAEKAGNQLILFTGAAALVVMVLVYLGHNVLLDVVFGHLAPDVRAYCSTYLLIVAASIPFIALYNSGAALFRIMGNSNVSMAVSIAMNTVNIAGNALLIYRLRMGVAGAAIPTLVSRVLAAVMMLAWLRSPGLVIRLRVPFEFRFDRGMVGRILRLGVPNGLENSMFQLGKILVLSLVSSFGTYAIAANAVCNVIAMFEILPGVAVNLAITTVIARCVGADMYDQAKYYTKKLILITYVGMWIMNLIIVLLLPIILRVYNLSDVTSEITRQIMYLYTISSMLVWPIAFSLPSTLRAAGDAQVTMYISMISMWVFRIVFSYILGKYLGMGVFGVWMAMIIDWCFRAVCMTIRYRGGRWMLKKAV